MKLPTFEESNVEVNNKSANALERFIYDNEPAGLMDSATFRNGLVDVLNATMEDAEPYDYDEE